MGLYQTPPKPSAMAKRLWHVLRAVYYMLYKGVSKHKLAVDLNLRLALEKSRLPSFSCRRVDPAGSFYAPREVEFSCSNTPFYATTARRRQQQEQQKRRRYVNAAAVARPFESLNASNNFGTDQGSSYSPRITDSPFPTEEEEEGGTGSFVDEEAEDFIRRFYQQLRSQQEALLGRACC